MSETLNIVDNPSANRFETTVDGHRAELIYRQVGERLVLVHTGVPDELEGRGIGGALVRAAVDTARVKHLTIVPRCEFARGWLERHCEEAGGVTIDWSATSH